MEIVDRCWENSEIGVLAFIAWGGVGKTSLVNHWLNKVQKDDYRDAKRVFGWSFHSQGADEKRQASAEEFVNAAFMFFGDKDPSADSPRDKALRLAEFIRRDKTLLILDGLEPLQHPTGELKGRLRDQTLGFLLKELMRSNPGLCIITTRLEVKELEPCIDSSVKLVPLGNLNPEAGASLLKLRGAKGQAEELRKASGEFGGHALTLTLLATYVAVRYDGDIRHRDKIPKIAYKEKDDLSRHARRILTAYEKLLLESPDKKIMHDILNMLALFDRPAEPDAIEALRAASIKGLTDGLHGDDEKWQFALKDLRDLKLLDNKPEGAKEDSLNCHPLIREHFAEKFKADNPDAWKEAHTVLYEHYKALPEKLYGKKLPDTLDEMTPLFAAVRHGCEAGRWQEVWVDVYRERIRRHSEAYSVQKLGAFGEDLSVLANFFETPWTKPISELTEAKKAVALSWAGFRLRGLGRLVEAVQPMKAGLEMSINDKDWKGAAINAGNISELLLTIGNVKDAATYARQSVEFADRSGDDFRKEVSRTTLADALHKAGETKEAEKIFKEAEAMQKKRQPEYRFLYSLRGFQYCDLLLSFGKWPEVLERAEEALKIVLAGSKNLLDIALNNLSIGKALMLKSIQKRSRDFSKAEERLDQAVEGLRKSGNQDDLPRGLLARAALHIHTKNLPKAHTDLNETKEIAESGGMKLHLTDFHLESCKLSMAEKRREDAIKHLEAAKKLVEETEYLRRMRDLKEMGKLCGK